MTTKMEEIYQHGLFSKMKSIGVYIPEESKYRILSECLPWAELAEIANRHRSKHMDIHRGAPLNLRLHLGAYIVQTMDGLTDRKAEEQVRYHAGVRLLCGVAGSTETIDHTSIEDFRNMVGPKGVSELNKIIVQHAVKEGFTGNRLCSSDTTVQEAAIATIKCRRYDFNRPRARYGKACITKGQMAIIGTNLNRLIRDLRCGLPISEAI